MSVRRSPPPRNGGPSTRLRLHGGGGPANPGEGKQKRSKNAEERRWAVSSLSSSSVALRSGSPDDRPPPLRPQAMRGAAAKDSKEGGDGRPWPIACLLQLPACLPLIGAQSVLPFCFNSCAGLELGSKCTSLLSLTLLCSAAAGCCWPHKA